MWFLLTASTFLLGLLGADPAADDAAELHRKARRALEQGQFEVAGRFFQRLIKTAPDSEQAEEAEE